MSYDYDCSNRCILCGSAGHYFSKCDFYSYKPSTCAYLPNDDNEQSFELYHPDTYPNPPSQCYTPIPTTPSPSVQYEISDLEQSFIDMYDELREAGYERYVNEALEILEQSQLEADLATTGFVEPPTSFSCSHSPPKCPITHPSISSNEIEFESLIVETNDESMEVRTCELERGPFKVDCGSIEREFIKGGEKWEVVDEPCEDFHVFTHYDMDIEWDESWVLTELKMPTINVNPLVQEKFLVESEKVSEPLVLKNKKTNELENEVACEFEVVTLEGNDSWTKHDEKCENSFKVVGLTPNSSNEYEPIEIDAKRGRYKGNFILSDVTNLNPSCEPLHIKDEYWSESEIFGMNVHGFKPTYLLFELKLCESFFLSKLIHYLHSRENCSSLFDKLKRSLVGFLNL